ncbi:MAG: hypothetical protein E7117_02580 [Bacteroidales bacterium]|nr:hypothetical protein [Bacteroidales bacterium]
MKKMFTVLIAAFLFLLAADDCMAQFSKMSIGDYGVESITPESFSSVSGTVWVKVNNPMEGFTVSDIHGMVYKKGSPFIQGTASDFRVFSGDSKVTVSGRAALCPGASIWSVLGLIFFEPSDYSVDLSLRITLDSGESRVVEKRGMPVSELLKLK